MRTNSCKYRDIREVLDIQGVPLKTHRSNVSETNNDI